ncbi:MAG: HAMP domain-containing sensor histidine kinase [Rickettsiales bacterium]
MSTNIGYQPVRDLRFYRLPMLIIVIGAAASIFAFTALLAMRHADAGSAFARDAKSRAQSFARSLALQERAIASFEARLTDVRASEESALLFLDPAVFSPVALYDVASDALLPYSGASSDESAQVPDRPDALRSAAMKAIKNRAATAKYGRSPSGETSAFIIAVPYKDNAKALLLQPRPEVILSDVNFTDEADENAPETYVFAPDGSTFSMPPQSVLSPSAAQEFIGLLASRRQTGPDPLTYFREIPFLGEKWKIAFVPNGGRLTAQGESLPWKALACGVGLTFVMGLLAFMVGRENKRVSMQAEERALALELQNRHLEHLTRCLEQSNEDMEQFTYAVSHDLKSPLRTIYTVMQMLEESISEKMSPEEREYMEIVRGRASKMGELLEQVLEFARTDDETRRGDEGGRVDLNHMVDNICGLIHVPDGFCVKGDETLARFTVDRLPLQQVLHNLIDNSLKHHDGKSGNVCVSAEECSEEYIRVTVKDDGPGILPEYEEKAFKMFRTLGNKGKNSGNGFGLAMARRLVLRYGGEICLGVGDGGKGLSCTFTWPKNIYGKRVDAA